MFPNGVFANNIFINTPFSYDLHKIDTKIDWNTTSKLRTTVRVSDYRYSQNQPPAFGEVLGGGYYNTNQFGNIYAISAMASYVASPHFVVDTVFGLSHATSESVSAFVEYAICGRCSRVFPTPTWGPYQLRAECQAV